MAEKHLSRNRLEGKVIDGHSHIGVGIKEYSCMEYPYAQTAEGIYYQQLAGGVDVNVVFPLSADLYFEPIKLLVGEKTPAKKPLSAIPYKTENHLLMREIFDYCPELSDRFLPFISVDPAREVTAQITELETLEKKYPIYGIKIIPVGCQSHVLELLGKGRKFLDFAQERDIPFIFHATTVPNDEYSQASDIFKIIERCPDIRFCLAHCLVFNRKLLEKANENPNVWVDTAAIKIQVEMARKLADKKILSYSNLIDADFSDYCKVMKAICEQYPDTMIWGTDTPAYAYRCRRKQGEGIYEDFPLKGRYEDEIAALNYLSAGLKEKAATLNILNFIFG